MGKSLKKNHQLEFGKVEELHFKLLILTGDLKGETHLLSAKRLVIGRSEKCDIRLNDVKASREHAEITKVGTKWVITDLGSQNGIIINDKKAIQKEVGEGDRIIIGQTVFKISKNEIQRPNTEDKFLNEVSSNSTQKDDSNNKPKNKLLPIILVPIIIYFFFMDDGQEAKKSIPTKKAPQKEVYDDSLFIGAEKKRSENQKKTNEKLMVYYQRGLRELREKNYFRAIHEFHLALNFSPGDAQAEYYIRKAKEELDREIEGFTAKAVRDEDSLKFKSALVSYCAILRLLYSVPEDPRYKNAEKQISEIEAKLGMKDGETNCLKK
jgi:pSer/pThr/pTyr-binding forkhead associated (FHA) protein